MQNKPGTLSSVFKLHELSSDRVCTVLECTNNAWLVPFLDPVLYILSMPTVELDPRGSTFCLEPCSSPSAARLLHRDDTSCCEDADEASDYRLACPENSHPSQNHSVHVRAP